MREMVMAMHEQQALAFDGLTYSAEHDGARLKSLLDRVYALMSDGEWRTLGQIVSACGGSEASVSARLRDFRKSKFQERCPCRDVERRRVGDGLWVYRVVV